MRADKTLDCYGLLCPMPIIQTAGAMKDMTVGQVLEVQATDQGIRADIPAWCRSTGQEFLGLEEEREVIRVYVKKVK